MKSFFLLSLVFAAENPPVCTRPASMSEPGSLKVWESCLKKQKDFCLKRSQSTFCKKTPGKIQKDVGKDCFVNNQGFYRCKTPVLNFIEKGEQIPPGIPKTSPEEPITENSPAPSPQDKGTLPSPTPSGPGK